MTDRQLLVEVVANRGRWVPRRTRQFDEDLPQVAYDRLPMSGHLMWLRQLPMPVCSDIEQAILPSRLNFCPDRE
jgi:hypothetical protein